MLNNLLDRITMYRLMVYYLIFLVLTAAVFSFLGFLSFNGFHILFSAGFLALTCWLANSLFARIFRVVPNTESYLITALILSLIMTPARSGRGLVFLFLAAVLAMASKYFLAINKKHIFNPAAMGVFLPSLFLGQAASWWVGSLPMVLPTLLGGLLILKKIQRWDLAATFIVITLLGSLPSVRQVILFSPLLFFALVMLPEPKTSPPKRIHRILSGVLVGLGWLRLAPETALLLGNIFSYAVSPKGKLVLELTEKNKLAADIDEFIFRPSRKPVYQPGQYLEWTLPHKNPDNRGNRRYFTMTSSPTEETLRIAVRFSVPSSSFKQALQNLKAGDRLTAGNPEGNFTLPKDKDGRLVFIAGGIGITPFRSMVKYLLDTGEKRNAVLFYLAKNANDFVYREIFDQAERLGVKTTYSVNRLTEDGIKNAAPDYKERIFYLSGPRSMTEGYEKMLVAMGVPATQIKTDYFPGYA